MSENIDEIIKGIRTRVEGTLGQGPVSIPLAYMTALCDEVERLRDDLKSLRADPLDASGDEWGIRCIEDHNAIIDAALERTKGE